MWRWQDLVAPGRSEARGWPRPPYRVRAQCQNLVILAQGRLQLARPMKCAGKLKCGSGTLGGKFDHASPDVDRLFEATVTHEHAPKANKRGSLGGSAGKLSPIDQFGRVQAARTLMPVSQHERPFARIKDEAEVHSFRRGRHLCWSWSVEVRGAPSTAPKIVHDYR